MTTNKSIELFNKAVRNIPAYSAFLNSKGFSLKKIRTKRDFATVPLTSKKDYLQMATHKDLVWPENWNHPLWFCSTSGSTGEPYYFPRGKELAEQASWMAESFIKNSSYGRGRTLVLMGFGMGVWIGGLLTLRAFEIATDRLNPAIAFLPTGYNKIETLKALKKLAPEFDQTILAGYPPFIKEIIDEEESAGIDLKRLNMRLLFAAEAFTETFRNYVCDKAGVKNPLLDTLNIYGTADVGAMAHETPVSILIRRLAVEDPLLFKDMFKQIEKTPTLAQYNPDFIEFEEVENEVVLTSDSALPFIRYAVGDHGGVYSYEQMEKLLLKFGISLSQEVKKAGIVHTITDKRPFVYVYERTDLSTTLNGIIIYPEFVKEGLLSNQLVDVFTERFTMSTKHDIYHNQFLQINLELQKNIDPNDELKRKALKAIQKSLIQKSSEFAEVSKSRNSATLIQIVLWPKDHPRYFAPGVKQKWVEKQ